MMEKKPNSDSQVTKGLRSLFVVMCVGVCLLMTIFLAHGMKPYNGNFSPEFEKAVAVIKKYEGLHRNKGNLVGYGHKILPGEKYKRNANLTAAQADELLRKDLAKLCAKYRGFGKDSLLLSALAYNCGIGVVAKSSVYKNLKAGNRDVKQAYLAHCRYRGKQLSQLKRRRIEEFETLYIPD